MVSIKDMNIQQLNNFVETKNYWINKYEEEERNLNTKIELIVKRLDNTDIKGLNEDIEEVFTIFEGEEPSSSDIIDMLNYEFDNKFLNKFVVKLIDSKIKLQKEYAILEYAQSVLSKKEETEEETEVQG